MTSPRVWGPGRGVRGERMGHAARGGRILEPSPPGSEVPGTMAVHDRSGRGRARLARSSPWFGLVLSALLALGRVVVIAPLRGARERGCDLCAKWGGLSPFSPCPPYPHYFLRG